MPLPTTIEIEAFYRASLVGLRVLDARAGAGSYRFGPDADARWSSAKGQWTASDRIALLCQDAAARWQAAFSPAVVFGASGLAPDEHVGPDWPGLPAREADRLWSDVIAAPLDASGDALDAIAEAWDVPTTELSFSSLEAGSQLVVGGAQAILGVARAFARRSDLDWSRQVVVVADTARDRHVAGLVAPVLAATEATRLVTPEGAAGLDAHLPLCSADATEAVRRAVRRS